MLILTTSWSEWFRIFPWFPLLPCFLPRLYGPFPEDSISISVALMFNSFFGFPQDTNIYLPFRFLFIITLLSAWTAKFTRWPDLLVLLIYTRSSRLANIILKFQTILYVSCFWTDSGLWFIPFCSMVKFWTLAQFPVETSLPHSCLVFYTFCASLLLPLIEWLSVFISVPCTCYSVANY